MGSALYAALDAGPKTKRERYEQLRAKLWSDRASYDAHWKEIADFLMPRRTRWWTGDRNKGDRRNQNIIDSTARYSIRTLQSGMHAGLTSPARPWMRMSTFDPELNEFGPVKEWLHVVTQRMLTIFIQTNLYNVLPIIYGDLGVFGTAAMAILEDDQELFRAYQYPVGSYAIGISKRGVATTFVRHYEMTVRQVVEEFGVRRGYRDIDWRPISDPVKHAWDRGNYEDGVEVCWIVCPNEEARPDRLDAKYLPWASCHYETGGEAREGKFLRESGFRSFPILAPRWDVTSGEDAYGDSCPGMDALGDVKQLQVEQRRKGQAIAKMVDPPLVGPSALRTQKTSLLPGDVTYVDQREGMSGLRSIHDVSLNLEHLARDIGEVQYRIQRAFYEDLFLMLASSDQRLGADRPTAREVEERHEEKFLALGPVVERTDDELLDPLVDRVFALMELHGLLPEPPEELSEVRLKVEYISILSAAQKLVAVVGQDRFLQSVLPLGEAYPEVRAKIDIYQVVDNYGDMLTVDPRIIIATDEAKATIEQQRQGQQQQAAAQQAMMMAKAAKDASGADMGADSALTRVAAGLGSPGGAV